MTGVQTCALPISSSSGESDNGGGRLDGRRGCSFNFGCCAIWEVSIGFGLGGCGCSAGCGAGFGFGACLRTGTEGETSGRGGMVCTDGTGGTEEAPSEPEDSFDALVRLYSNTRHSLWVTLNGFWNEGDVGVDAFVLIVSE